ncbi:cytochrome C oxidase subunit II [Cohnella lubricantis]|uniref:Cytochrome C oxidase subunit II n=1 Tax=Cohnella lubricantis TaxID=2163172 RepID=A0A841TL80_9BACL|nr:cytochrome C oxidase subunit II [Cohnella lubricantis]MBB6679301.1 cytochrome C oxidase subunit II [Cohnella lubricantis]MBP2120390.1 cytochrome c oxidase subunit 2 [Cohnella lubricantis]
MYKWIMPALIVIACLFGVYLLAQGLPEKPKEEQLAEGTELLKITATNFNFNEEEYHVKAGTPYVISFSNNLGNHGAAIDELNINLTKDNPRMEYTFTEPGTYDLHCSIQCGQGHAGMTAKVIVE